MNNNSEDNKRIANNTIFLYLRMFLLMLVVFYTTRLVLKALGVSDYGLYNAVAGFAAMVTFIDSSISSSIQRFLNYELGKGNVNSLNECFGVSILTCIILSAFLLLVAETLGLWFLNYKLNVPSGKLFAANFIYQTSVCLVVVNIARAPYNALIIAKEKMKFYAVLSLIEAFMQLGMAYVLMVVQRNRLELYGSLLLFVSVVVTICNIVYCKHICPSVKTRVYYRKEYLKGLFSFCGWSVLGAGAGIMKSEGINILMNIFFNVTVNAARGIAFQILSGVWKLSTNFQVAMKPQIIQSYAQGNMQRYFQLTYMCSKLSLYLMWLLTLPILVSIDTVLRLWLGDNVPEKSGLFVQLILLTALIDSLACAIATPMYATGNIKRYQIEVSLIILTILPLSWGAYKLGMPAESSMCVSLVMSIVAHFFRIRIWCKELKESPMIYIKQIVMRGVFVMSISLVLSAFMWSILGHNILSLILFVMFTLCVNILLIYFFGIQTRERTVITTMVKKKLLKWKR
jgi:O-antigen/teichoic acid export membrane protein